jgi:hypothetical protein
MPKCPVCQIKDSNTYIGFNSIECNNPVCSSFFDKNNVSSIILSDHFIELQANVTKFNFWSAHSSNFDDNDDATFFSFGPLIERCSISFETNSPEFIRLIINRTINRTTNLEKLKNEQSLLVIANNQKICLNSYSIHSLELSGVNGRDGFINGKIYIESPSSLMSEIFHDVCHPCPKFKEIIGNAFSFDQNYNTDGSKLSIQNNLNIHYSFCLESDMIIKQTLEKTTISLLIESSVKIATPPLNIKFSSMNLELNCIFEFYDHYIHNDIHFNRFESSSHDILLFTTIKPL